MCQRGSENAQEAVEEAPDPYEDEGDPIDYPCDDCGAEVGERCRPTCTALGEVLDAIE